MPRRVTILNVRQFVAFAQDLGDLYAKHGDCPAFGEELNKLRFLAKCILRKADERRAKGNRKDLYVEAPTPAKVV